MARLTELTREQAIEIKNLRADLAQENPGEKLDWAMQQIQRTLDQNGG